MTPKNVAILGSTGSIGLSALKVISGMPERLRVWGLAASSNVEALLAQAREFRPERVALFEPKASAELKSRLASWKNPPRALECGVEGLCELAAAKEVDVVLTSLVGGVGFAPLLAALKAGKTVALANKEPMVMAGEQFMLEARRWGARILPVDSEPSALFQCFESRAEPKEGLRGYGALARRVLLTASGGAFYKRKGDLSRVSVAEALAHPTWRMGRKITVDCATLMNKGLEAVEIKHLFGLKLPQIEILVHPQSVVHSAVEFLDGSILAQLSIPDMRLPIQYALTWPERVPGSVEPLDFAKAGVLEFSKPDFSRFPCLELALEAARAGGAACAVLNAADEVAVEAFAAGRILFTDIPRVLEGALKAYAPQGHLPSFAEVAETDQWARRKAGEFVAALRKRKEGAACS